MSLSIPVLVQAAGGEIAGRVRMQKTVYLLDQLGLGSGLDYEYHYYGPYSEALTELVEDAVIFDDVDAVERRRQRDGAPYVVYRSKRADEHQSAAAAIRERFGEQLQLLRDNSVTVLELAATAHWLVRFEKRQDWQDEIVRRKGVKTEGGRLEEALRLLGKLKLQPTALPGRSPS